MLATCVPCQDQHLQPLLEELEEMRTGLRAGWIEGEQRVWVRGRLLPTAFRVTSLDEVEITFASGPLPPSMS
jgi:hypothetical protein